MSKRILIIIIVLMAGFLYACSRDDNEQPTPEEGFVFRVHGTAGLEIHDVDSLAGLTLRSLTVDHSPVLSTVYAGIRLMDLFAAESTLPDGLQVISLDAEMPIAIDPAYVYLVMGNMQDGQFIPFDNADIFAARIRNRKIEVMIERPTDLYPRIFDPDHAIYYIHYNSVPGRYDGHTSLRAMQGIINRAQPRLLTLTGGNPFFRHSDDTWLQIIEAAGYDLIEIFGLEGVLHTFKDHFNGIIAFKDNLKSYNQWVSAESDFALMMASLVDAAPLPFGLHTVLEAETGLPFLETFEVAGHTLSGDITSYLQQEGITDAYGVYEHVFNRFRTVFNRTAYMSLTSEVMDYAASEQMMFFDLKMTQSERDRALSEDINAWFQANNTHFSVYGWVDHESSALDFISKYGGVINVVGNGNLSLLSRLPIDPDTVFTQKAEYVSTYDTDKKYVTFFASESDTIKVGVAFQHGAWLDPHRGKVPINWGLIADMSETFPFVFDYFYRTATPNDYFYSGGGSAIGFVDIDSQMPLESRNSIAAANAYYLALADQHIIDMYNDRYTPTDAFAEKDLIGNYLMRSAVFGAFTRIHDGNTSIRVETWGGVPVYNRWTNFYPRRAASGHVSFSALTMLGTERGIQTTESDYWFIETTLADTTAKTGFDLFTNDAGDGFRIYFEDGRVHLDRLRGGAEEPIDSRIFNMSGRQVKVSIDKSTPLDEHVRIMLTVNDLVIIDHHEVDAHVERGGFALFSEDGVTQTFQHLTGTRDSMARQIYHRIVNDNNRFIVAYYGFVGSPDHSLSMYRSEPGIQGVISLSPTDFYKIHLMLEASHPGVYQIVNAYEFLDYANQYQQYFGTLR
ncbi:MAG: hypothetical protein EA375_05345 [Acholeplasmataceae bacterium]|nr:MAG: hypothetical protein EA375_05345 [Acholeplasmataceae bacterium]